MKRTLLCASTALLLCLTACQTPNERAALRMLPEDGPAVTYPELLTRARAQATFATEAFYVNRWGDLEDAARGLVQTARYLSKADDAPAGGRDKLAMLTEEVTKEAEKLRDAARNRDEKGTTDALQRLHVKVRELRVD